MLRKVDAVVFFVQDLETMMKFYRDVIGLEVTFNDDVSYAFRFEGQDFALLKDSAAVDMLGAAALALATTSSHRMMLCVDVDDVDATYNALKARGLTFIKPPVDQPWGPRTTYFADPEGNIWEIRRFANPR